MILPTRNTREVVFNIGLNKTGTMSLAQALRILGYDVKNSAQENLDLCMQITEDYSPFTEHEAYVDGPLWKYIDLIIHHHPNAKFICTIRDKESWIISRIVHILHARIAKSSPYVEIHTKRWSKEYEHHRQKIASLPQNVLMLSVINGEGWEKLCPFLDKRIPDVPFPGINTGISKLEKILDIYSREDSVEK